MTPRSLRCLRSRPSLGTVLARGRWGGLLVGLFVALTGLAGGKQPGRVGLLVSSAGAAPPKAIAGRGPASKQHPLAVVDQTFLDAYQRARQEELAAAPAIIVLEEDQMILLKKNPAGQGGPRKRLVANVIPPIYTSLQSVAHVPVAVFVLAEPFRDRELSEANLSLLRRLLIDTQRAQGGLQQYSFSPEQWTRQQQILADSVAMITTLLESKQVDGKTLDAFCRQQAGAVMANGREAAVAQLREMDRALAAWKTQLTPQEWTQLRVVISGATMARRQDLAMQFFRKRLPGRVDERRLLYYEGDGGEDAALSLLGTDILDTAIGAAFFDNPLRMHRDLLGGAAADYLDAAPAAP